LEETLISVLTFAELDNLNVVESKGHTPGHLSF
jgi:glyoxylase-like metal-dependent hydrolase (beta-lactamase superfamily II)